MISQPQKYILLITSEKYILLVTLMCKFMLSVNLWGNLILSVLKFTNSHNHEEYGKKK